MLSENGFSDREWWKYAVVYQIYPRSFQDSNSDGNGDIQGIISRLDYLKWLGVDALWISPINSSPMCDCGYDIMDYYNIDPMFGSLDDFRLLLEKAHSKNIRIIMDMVLNHTSDRHPWFIESASSPEDKKHDWYIWHDGRFAGAPNNWLAAFGGRAWEWNRNCGEYYLHSFLKEQPDLNWRNHKVKNAMYAVLDYWLAQGVDGFRLDAINYLIKDEYFTDNSFKLSIIPRFYEMQKHEYDRNRPECHRVIQEIRSVVKSHQKKYIIGEVFSPPPGAPELSADYVNEQELDAAFDFSLIYRPFSSIAYYRVINRWLRELGDKSWPVWVLGNHDQPRMISRYSFGLNDQYRMARVAAAMLLTLKGTPYIYYGEEIGMKNGTLSLDDICDPLGKRYWPIFNGRDPFRTPMQWNSNRYAGFSDVKPWIPVNNDLEKINVETQQQDGKSLLHFYRELIHLRKRERALLIGEMVFLCKGYRGYLSYKRIFGNEIIYIYLNFSGSYKVVPSHLLQSGEIIYSTWREIGSKYFHSMIKLKSFEVTIIKIHSI